MSSHNSNLGLKISLPAGTLSQLKQSGSGSRKQQSSRRQTDNNNNIHAIEKVNDDANGDVNGDANEWESSTHEQTTLTTATATATATTAATGHLHNDLENNPREENPAIKEDDRDIMPFYPSDDSSKGFDDDNYIAYSDNENDNDSHESDCSTQSDEYGFDNISLSPPSSMPLLAVELNKLCGFIPTEEAEAKTLGDELCEALLGLKITKVDSSSAIDNDDNKDDHDDDDDANVVTANDDDDDDDGGGAQKNNDKNLSTAITTTDHHYEYGNGYSLDFTSRAVELLEAGIAQHSDTIEKDAIMANEEQNENKLNYVFVPYPEFLVLSSTSTTTTTSATANNDSLMATTQIWKRILYPHDIPVVHKLLQLLSKSSKDLLWKYQMSLEIRKIAKREIRWKEEKIRRKEVRIWRKQKRPDELAKLYDVRETFTLKLDMLRKKHEGYLKEREERVHRELIRRKEKGIGNGGISGLDFDGSITFAFDDDIDEITNKIVKEKCTNNENFNDGKSDGNDDDDDDDDDDGYHQSSSDEFDDDHDDGYDCDDDGDNEKARNRKGDIQINNDISVQPKNVIKRNTRRSKAASKRMRLKLEVEKERAKASEIKAKLKAALVEEDQVRQTCMSTDEKLALVMVQDMENRLEKIDTLLDSLQLEEWEDEEDGVSDSDESEQEEDTLDDENNEMTLLDRILAMTLGALPIQTSDAQHHFTNLKQKHTSIVNEWKLTFGRLPSLLPESETDHGNKEDPEDDLSIQKEWDNIDENYNQTKIVMPPKIDFLRLVPDDWEDESECDELELPGSSPEISHVSITTSQSNASLKSTHNNQIMVPKIGLRPGGKL